MPRFGTDGFQRAVADQMKLQAEANVFGRKIRNSKFIVEILGPDQTSARKNKK